MMRYRGPDDVGISTEGGFTLGMARLKIIDTVSPGLCPIRDGDYALVFNGELYNYIELKHELEELGEKFTTQGDGEVLLKAYRKWGTEALDRFNFMGAFAISNGTDVFLARDIAGEKPLYYRVAPSFSFASEAKALGYDCVEFPPAHYGIYNIGNRNLDIRKWWSPPQGGTYCGTLGDAITGLDILLADSVRLRTRAHVPYGLYRSGGIDSSLISSYHNFEHQFTYDDTHSTEEEFKETFPKILWHLDYPVKTFSPFGLWKLAEEASKKVKVVLSGEGADELFGGYVRFVPNEFNRKAQHLFPSYQALFPYKDMLAEEFNGNMRELLRMGDRMAAAYSIENRCPFLDRRVIEFAMRLPMEFKIQGYETKVVLRELIKRRLPTYQFEEKKGLYVKVNEWLGESNPFDKRVYLEYQYSLWKKSLLQGRVALSGTTSSPSLKTEASTSSV